MMHFLKNSFTAVWLVSLTLSLLSCEEESTPLKKQKVQFSFSTSDASSGGRAKESAFPEGTRLKVSIESNAGETVLENYELEIIKAGDGYIAEALELLPGAYVLTDFMLTSNSEMLYAAPKAESPLSAFVSRSIPFSFTVTENNLADVNMQVIDARDFSAEDFGYAAFSANVMNILSISPLKTKGGKAVLTQATAEIRQGKKLIRSFQLDASVNKIAFPGDPNTQYTLTIFTREEAKVTTFNFQQLKNELKGKPLKVTLVPALILTLEGHTSEGYEWDDDFELLLEGEGGSVHVDWGDGSTDSGTLPFEGGHEFTSGTYTCVITGDIHKVVDFWGFAYETYMADVAGLTNLTALKNYNPSWGAISLKIDLSKCYNLESIFIEKYGAPYTPVNLLTDFKLPSKHYIRDFVFYAPGIEESRGKITAEELEMMVVNIHENSTNRNIHDGRFIVTPVNTPSPETTWRLESLQGHFDWSVGLNSDEIYDYGVESGRVNLTLEARKENWLRNRLAQRSSAVKGQSNN